MQTIGKLRMKVSMDTGDFDAALNKVRHALSALELALAELNDAGITISTGDLNSDSDGGD